MEMGHLPSAGLSRYGHSAANMDRCGARTGALDAGVTLWGCGGAGVGRVDVEVEVEADAGGLDGRLLGGWAI